MTALGKALTFFNVLFAIITGVLIVNVYITRTNWRVGMELAQQETKAAQAAAAAAESAAKQKAIDLEEDKRKLQDKIKQLDTRILGLDEEIKVEKEKVRNADVAAVKDRQLSQAGSVEINRLQVERNQMADQLKKANEDLATVTKNLADTSDRETFNRLRAAALEKDLSEKNERLGQLQRKHDELRAQLPAGGNRGAQPLPPRVPSVETAGTVTGVSGNLAQISLGSDNGIEQGHILQVYRLGNQPDQALYVGTLTITRTQAHAAVGTFEPAGRGKTIQKDDRVDTRILR